MNNWSILEGIVLTISGFIMLNKKVTEMIIKIENKIAGVKSDVSTLTLKTQQFFGIVAILIGIYSLVVGFFPK